VSLSLCRNRCPYYVTATAVAVVVVVENSQSRVDFFVYSGILAEVFTADAFNLGPDLQNILRQSYDYLTIMPTLRSTLAIRRTNLSNILRRTQG